MSDAEIVLMVLVTVVIALQVVFLAVLIVLMRKVQPMLATAQQLLGANGGLAGMLQQVKGTKPMDLLALGAVTVLPQIAPHLGGIVLQGLGKLISGGNPPPPTPPTIPVVAEVVGP